MNKIAIKIRNLLLSIFILTLTFSIYGCDDPTDPTSINIFSLEDDVKLGKQLDSIILSDAVQYPLLKSESANKYVQDIINTIIKSPEVKNSDVFKYNIKIIQ